MCELCDESEDDVVSCQDCGRTICFDNEPSDVDVVDCAYVTASGDLFCRRCGRQYDAAEAEEEEYEDDYFPTAYDAYEFNNWDDGN